MGIAGLPTWVLQLVSYKARSWEEIKICSLERKLNTIRVYEVTCIFTCDQDNK